MPVRPCCKAIVPDHAGDLGRPLCDPAGGKLRKAFFASSGCEGMESAIKFSRAATDGNGLLYTNGAFHSLTCGALSMMGDEFWPGKFGPMLPDTFAIPFNDRAALGFQNACQRARIEDIRRPYLRPIMWKGLFQSQARPPLKFTVCSLFTAPRMR